jgi:hypothetical protein
MIGGRGEGLVAGRVALYPSSFSCLAFMIKKLCLWKWYKRAPPLSVHSTIPLPHLGPVEAARQPATAWCQCQPDVDKPVPSPSPAAGRHTPLSPPRETPPHKTTLPPPPPHPPKPLNGRVGGAASPAKNRLLPSAGQTVSPATAKVEGPSTPALKITPTYWFATQPRKQRGF